MTTRRERETAGGTTGKKRRRMRKVVLLGERRGRSQNGGEEKGQRRYSRVTRNISLSTLVLSTGDDRLRFIYAVTLDYDSF